MNEKLLSGALLLDPEAAQPTRGALLLANGRIVQRFPASAKPPEAAEQVDLSGFLLAPGFLDLHYHGDLIFREPADYEAGLNASSASLLRHGTTGFVPTTLAWGTKALLERVGALSQLSARTDCPGAMPLGLHLEGPWILAEAAGAQPREGIRAPAAREVAEVLARGAGMIRMVTFAPEIPGSAELQRELARRGIVAALGHSLASDIEVEAAIARGASHVTHLFNAMGPLHHRAPGLSGSALVDDRLTCDLICDGAHVHRTAVKMAARMLGERLILITDRVEPPAADAAANETAALGDPLQDSLGSAALRADGVAIRLADGRLAGSCLTLDLALRNLRRFALGSLLDAVAACTLRPAKVLGIEAERGTLRVGARADFAILDAGGHVVETWVGGRSLFRARDSD